MSTILKALQELERRDSHFVRSDVSATQAARRGRWGILSASLLALLGAAVGVASLMRGGAAPPAQSDHTSSAERRSVPAAPGPAVQKVIPPEPPPAVPQTSSAKEDVPEGGATKPQPAAPARVRQPAVLKEKVATSQAKQPRQAPPPKPAADKYPLIPAQPRVQLKAIAYGEKASDSSVTLRINGGDVVTLHEGDSIGGVEVQLILPDTVYLHYGGNVFTISLVP